LAKSLIGYYSSLWQAEEVIYTETEEHWNVFFAPDEYCGHFCYMITEFQLDETEYYNQPETRRSYLTNGNLNDICLTCERGNCVYDYHWDKIFQKKHSIGDFLGRTPEQIRFKKGDLVEVMDDNRVFLGIIISPPLSREVMQEGEKKREDTSFHNYSEDCYCVLEYDRENKTFTRTFPLSVYVFPPRLSISDELRESLQSVL
jgi:hypothetical protein